ncbi:MAG: hypothetical protein B7Y39_07560 [Bdellovibrio sp. 28-41-41]|nr:MAG: hypothetical protein B7Y39_07560 [Bdellovibrio sp. 28-41-41]
MKKINTSNRNSLRQRFFPHSFRVPTEFQINTWENEGGCLNGNCDVVIINGVLCQTWFDRVKATMGPYLKNVKSFFSVPSASKQQPSL